MRRFYTALLWALMPFILLRLLWRSIKAPAYRQRWAERFGFVPQRPADAPAAIWIHAVSVGEVQAIVPLVKALQAHCLPNTLLVTTTTPTGSAHLRATLGQSVQHVYLPYDVPFAIQRFLTRQRPRLLLLVETELWPNLLYCCQQQQCATILINARLSARSARGYQRFARFTQQTLACLDHIAAQATADAERFQALGATAVSVCGNLKFDATLPPDFAEQAAALRHALDSPKRLIWLAASTHDGEESVLLSVHQHLRQQWPHLLLILVPRHPERFNTVARLCQAAGFQLKRRTETQCCDEQTAVYLGDTMGELQLLYGAADLAFVGGSLVPNGGHNPLEPALVGLSILSGPYIFNFYDIYQQLVQVQGAYLVTDASALQQQVQLLLQDAALRQQRGEAAQQFLAQNRGALQKTLHLIRQYAPF